MKKFAIALLVLLAPAAGTVWSADAPAVDPCSPKGQYVGRLKLETGLKGLASRYPWIKQATSICATPIVGAAAGASDMALGCLTRACGGQPSCAADIESVKNGVKASAEARQALWQQHTCKLPGKGLGPLDTYFALSLAKQEGDVAKVRMLASGSDSEIAQDLDDAKFDAAISDFFRSAQAASNPESAEMTRLLFGPQLRDDPEQFLHYNVVMKSPTSASIQWGPSTVAYMVLEEKQWKLDTTEEPATDSTNAAMGQLFRFAFEQGAKVLREKRAMSPVAVGGAIQQCILIGQFRLKVDIALAESDCARMIGVNFTPASEPEVATSAHGAVKAGPSSDAAAMSARVDEKFIIWSRERWQTDRYVPGSAQVANQECTSEGCRASGSFQFLRWGNPMAASFDSVLSKQSGGDFAVRQLCYSDQGQSECMP